MSVFSLHRYMVLSAAVAALLAAQTFWAAKGFAQKNAPPDDDSGKVPGDKDKGDDDKGNKDDAKKRKQTAAACVSHTTEARHIMGYDHLVHIKNACESEATCKVSTDVNPQIQLVTVAPGQTKSVLTFRGSPAREFKATVECRLATE